MLEEGWAFMSQCHIPVHHSLSASRWSHSSATQLFISTVEYLVIQPCFKYILQSGEFDCPKLSGSFFFINNWNLVSIKLRVKQVKSKCMVLERQILFQWSVYQYTKQQCVHLYWMWCSFMYRLRVWWEKKIKTLQLWTLLRKNMLENILSGVNTKPGCASKWATPILPTRHSINYPN